MRSLLHAQSLSPTELERFSTVSQGIAIQPAFELVHRAFEDKARSQSTDVAVEQDGRTIAYGELDRKANTLANHLIKHGLKPGEKVCLVAQRSIPLVVGIFAILKAGCQYVPLDGGVVPELLLSHVVVNTGASVVLCLQRYFEKVKRCTTNQSVVAIDVDLDNGLSASFDTPVVTVTPADGAYVIYTSGTTGTPKGVDVTHQNVTNLLCQRPGSLGIQRGTIVPQLLSVSFDMGQWEILGTLLNGGTLLLRTSDWDAALRRANVVIATPSILATLQRESYPSIHTVALAGEPCPKSLADDWSQHVNLYNCCGPTEVTIVNTMSRHVSGTTLSIGGPNPNTNVYILDEDENPVKVGDIGVMWAGGRCVSKGYVGMPELTGKKFKVDKFVGDGSFMFNTGDLGRWLEDGTLENHGRVDDQVKIKGFRVELDGVSAAIEKVTGVTRACAILHECKLWGFYSGPSSLDEALIKAVVTKHQPYYSVPEKWEHRSILPLTSNGKTDRRALIASIGKPQLTVAGDNEKQLLEQVIDLSRPEKVHVKINTKPAESESSSSTNSLKEIDFSLPEKHGRHVFRSVRHRVFSLYRRFFTLVTIVNLATLVGIMVSPRMRRLEYIATAIASNLTASVLFRQEYVVNLLFWIACSVPVSAPLWIRRNCAKVFHIGGLHSGFAVGSVTWLLVFTVMATIQKASPAVLTITYVLDCLLLAICALAHPTFRAKAHNHFELTHRFAGWTALALFWVQTFIQAADTRSTAHQSLGYILLRTPGIWLLTVATASIVLPWINLRKVEVKSEVLSPHAVRLHFNYTTPVVGTAVRISERPLMEWHAFATISKPAFPIPPSNIDNEYVRNDGKGFSLLVSNAGDWTKRQINRAPTKLYVRGVPACGVLRIAPLFKSIVLVATGSGIGPCLPVIYRCALTKNLPPGSKERHIPIRVFWSTPNPLKTFGQEIQDAILAADPDAVIHDTRTMGRPDMVAVSWRLKVESGAEAVCVIANQKLTQRVVYGMESRGVPGYGAIFDS